MERVVVIATLNGEPVALGIAVKEKERKLILEFDLADGAGTILAVEGSCFDQAMGVLCRTS